jgi:TrmH family RNA methyltransferase
LLQILRSAGLTTSPEDWLDAIKRIALTDPKRAWLRAHLDAPDCTATEEQLAAKAGQPISAYRALATELAVALETDPPEDPLDLLAERAGEGQGETAWRLRPALAFGLGAHRLMPEAWTRGGKPAADLAPPPGESPVIVLVRPQLAENIGAVARAMANGGLFHLRLVAPRDGWPQDRAWRTASGADPILEAATVFPDVPSAVADCHRVFATCPRPRHIVVPLRTARAAAEDLREINGQGLRTAVLFGPERAGLENDDVACADTLVRYPLNPAHMSLNLAQAVMILAYEWWTAAEPTSPRQLQTHETAVATKGQLEGFLDRLVAELDAAGFLDNLPKRPGMVRNLRHWFERGEVTEQELRTLHGVVTELSRGRMRRGRPDPDQG